MNEMKWNGKIKGKLQRLYMARTHMTLYMYSNTALFLSV